MKRVVLIDGENLTYGLRYLLGMNGQLVARSEIEGFSFRGLIEELLEDNLPAEILWFGARLRVYTQTEELRQKSSDAIELQARFVNEIQRQRMTFIKIGYLRAREIELQSGGTEWRLTEKGVDVGLAVRIVTEADEDTEVVVISADTDLLPAFSAAKKRGSRLMHVTYEHRPITALSRAADATRVITVPLARKYRAAA